MNDIETNSDSSEPTGNLDRIMERAEAQRRSVKEMQEREQERNHERTLLRQFMKPTDAKPQDAYMDIPLPFNAGDKVLQEFNAYLEKTTDMRPKGHPYITIHPKYDASIAHISLADLIGLTVYFSGHHALTKQPIDPDMRDVFAALIEGVRNDPTHVPMDIPAQQGENAEYYEAAFNLLNRKNSDAIHEFTGQPFVHPITKQPGFLVGTNFADYQTIQKYRFHELNDTPLRNAMAGFDLIERFDVDAFKNGEPPIPEINFGIVKDGEAVVQPYRFFVDRLGNNDDEGPNRGGSGGKPSRVA